MMNYKFFTYLAFSFIISTSAIGQNTDFFENGNELYNDGKYAEAIENYEKILDQGEHSAALYYNLGNSYYKLNNIASSIYYLEKALLLDPNDEDIKNNLSFARNMTIDAIVEKPDVGFGKMFNNFSKSFSFENWALFSVLGVILFVTVFLIYYFAYSSAKKRLFFISSLVVAMFVGVSLFMAFHNYHLQENDKPAIVFAEESQVKSEPNLRGTVAFVLHEGTKVQILETVEDWDKIMLADGKSGWIAKEDIRPLSN